MHKWMVGVLLLSSVASAATYRTTANVTLREDASTAARKVAIIPAGTSLTMACSGTWCRTTYRGQSGYVAKAYTQVLTRTTSLTAAPTPAQKAEVFYANCSAARAAGAAPLYAGEPGYRPKLDRDSDGIACE